MSTKRVKSVPNYRKHKQSGQAIVTLTDSYGRRKDVLLGKHGSASSRAEYARAIAEWEANGRQLPGASVADLTIAELIDRFWPWVQTHYRRQDGTETREVIDFKYSLRPLNPSLRRHACQVIRLPQIEDRSAIVDCRVARIPTMARKNHYAGPSSISELAVSAGCFVGEWRISLFPAPCSLNCRLSRAFSMDARRQAHTTHHKALVMAKMPSTSTRLRARPLCVLARRISKVS